MFINGSLSNAISSMYLKKHSIRNETVSNVKEMITIIIKEFQKIITKISWMDHLTKDKVLKKVENIIGVVGYKKTVLDDNFLSE